MTYRGEIQIMISNLQDIYDKVGYLRDQSDRECEVVLNKIRELLPPVWDVLQKHDNILSKPQASVEV